MVLAGGEGRRLGGGKENLRLREGRLIDLVLSVLKSCFARVLVVGKRSDEIDLPPGVVAVPDEFPGAGPLVGVATGLGAMGEEWGFFCGCDMPRLSAEFVRELWARARELNGGAVVPRIAGDPEPLHAFYSSTCGDAARRLVRSGERAPRALFARVPVLYVDVAPGSASALSFTNVNTPEDLQDFLSAGVEPPAG